jgi:hypothetical protein
MAYTALFPVPFFYRLINLALSLVLFNVPIDFEWILHRGTSCLTLSPSSQESCDPHEGSANKKIQTRKDAVLICLDMDKGEGNKF